MAPRVLGESEAAALQWVEDNLVPSDASNGRFISPKKLQAYLTYDKVLKILEETRGKHYRNGYIAHQICADNAVCAILHERRSSYSLSAGFRAAFVILLRLGLSRFIVNFIQTGTFRDGHPPLKKADFPPIGDGFFKLFDAEQHSFCAPTFVTPMDNHFSTRTILPVIKKTELDLGRHAESKIYIVELDSDFDELAHQAETTHRHTYVFKEFELETGKELYDAEIQAYSAIYIRGQAIDSLLGCYGSFTYGTRCIIVLEYAAAGTLGELLRSDSHWPIGRLSDQKALMRSVIRLADAVCRTHDAGICHQDIHPDNILLCKKPLASEYEFNMKLADFGRSAVVNPVTRLASDKFGGKEHGSPEMHREGEYAETSKKEIPLVSDVWSLGTTWLLVLVYMNGGSRAVQRFQEKRLDELKDLRKMDGIARFHDGHQWLDCVKQELRKLHGHGAGHLASYIAEHLIGDMLHRNPANRRTSQEVIGELIEATIKSDDADMMLGVTVSTTTPGSSQAQTSIMQEDVFTQDPESHSPPTPIRRPPTWNGNSVPAARSTQVPSRSATTAEPLATRPPRANSTNLFGSRQITESPGVLQENVFPRPTAPSTPSRAPMPVQPGSSQQFHSRHMAAFREQEAERHSRSAARSGLLNPHDDLPGYSPFPEDMRRRERSPNPSAPGRSSDQDKLAPPSVSVTDAREWLQSIQRGHAAHLPYHEYLSSGFRDRRQILVLDNSTSMTFYMPEARSLLDLLSHMLESPGQKLLLYRANGYSAIRQNPISAESADQLMSEARSTQAMGTSNISNMLGPILKAYKRELEDDIEDGRRTQALSLYIFTDGKYVGDDDLYASLLELVTILQRSDIPGRQVSIQFIAFGGSKQKLHAAKAMRQDTLERRYRDGALDPIARMHLLDIMSKNYGLEKDLIDLELCDGNVWKMLLGAIEDRFDDD